MENQEKSGHDTDKALAKAGSVTPTKKKNLQTEDPIAEKDEVRQAEDEQRKRRKSKNP